MAPLPQDISKKKQRALELINQGRLREAKQLYQKLLKKTPADAGSWFMLGTVEGRMGNLVGAENAMCKSLQANSELPEAWLGLGQVLELQGRLDDACDTYLKAISNKPDLADAHVSVGRIYLAKVRFANALVHLEQAIKLGVNKPQVVSAYGEALNGNGRFRDAIEIYQNLLQQFPQSTELLCKLGNLHYKLSEMDLAYGYYQQVLEIESGNIAAQLGVINVLHQKKEDDKALSAIESLFENETKNLPVAIEYSTLCHLMNGCDKAVSRLETLLNELRVTPQDEVLACFELGRLYDASKQYDKAFEYYQRGNKLKEGQYNSQSVDESVSAIISGYPREAMNKHSRVNRARGKPLFIIGMPRSGTSLVEQVLSSHPDVFGAGELTDLAIILRNKRGGDESIELVRHEAEKLTVDELDQMAEKYLARLDQVSNGELYVSDKMPGNYTRLGLIAMLFPEAKIIHCKRNPIDTCLSCYFHDFSGYHPHSYDLDGMVHYYKNYQRLMEHWHMALPLPIHDVEYEALVADQEGETRRMLEFLGLEWDDRCMQFHKSDRVVVTSSQAQVQKPIYHSSVSRWKNYEKHIAPLIKGLT